MATANRTFSEFWYRVATLRVSLHPQVRVCRQYYRGERWYLLHDPFNNQFHRVRPAAYDFLVRLGPDCTVQAAWEACLAAHPADAPGQADVLHLLTQLYAANLLHYELPPESEAFFERYRKRVRREQQALWLNVMFARFPLWDPEALMRRLQPLARLLFGWPGLVAWLAAVGWAVKVGLENAEALREQTQSVLAPGNLFLLYIGLALVKVIHELGHALACKRYGGEVHTLGVMLLIFTPVPYVDVTSSWAFRARRQRIVVAAAGMLAELFVAAGAMVVWAATSPGVVHSVAYNMIFVASVSSVLFNGNPLLRYDGYYILADLLDIPNLHGRASRQLRHLAERYLFGRRASRSPAQGRREAVWLACYGLLSGAYRAVVFSAMILLVARRYLIVGALMAVACAVAWGGVPLVRFAGYLAASPALERTRARALAATAGLAAGLALLLAVLPLPCRFLAPGVLRAVERDDVSNAAAGRLAAVLTPSGQSVTNGQPLVRLADDELDLDLAAVEARLAQALAMQRRALRESTADLGPLAQYLAAVRGQRERLLQQRAGLIVRAPRAGLWIAPVLAEQTGVRIDRGTLLGSVVNPARFRFVATVSQAQASRLYDGGIRHAAVRLRGRAGQPLAVLDRAILPAERRELPSAALGWRGGGEVAVTPDDRGGTRAAETFFEVRAELAPAAGVWFCEGRTGRICFRLPPEPLLQQGLRRLRQALQREPRA